MSGVETALVVSAIAATAAAAAGGYASYQQSKAVEASAEYDAEVAEINARNARAEAGEAEEEQRRAARSALANMRGAASERGIDFAQSSSWDLYRQSAMDAEFDALTIRRKGEVQALGLVAQSQGSRFAAKQAGKAATYGAGASALATAAAAADGYGTYKYRTAGRTTGGEVD